VPSIAPAVVDASTDGVNCVAMVNGSGVLDVQIVDAFPGSYCDVRASVQNTVSGSTHDPVVQDLKFATGIGSRFVVAGAPPQLAHRPGWTRLPKWRAVSAANGSVANPSRLHSFCAFGNTGRRGMPIARTGDTVSEAGAILEQPAQ
jgi:hypothetical protein